MPFQLVEGNRWRERIAIRLRPCPAMTLRDQPAEAAPAHGRLDQQGDVRGA
jgi:hypothetical protein